MMYFKKSIILFVSAGKICSIIIVVPQLRKKLLYTAEVPSVTQGFHIEYNGWSN